MRQGVAFGLVGLFAGALGGWLVWVLAHAEPAPGGRGVAAREADATPSDAGTLEALDARVQCLEHELAELRARSVAQAAPTRTPLDGARAGAEASAKPDALSDVSDGAVEELRMLALDPARSTRERAVATQRLWRIDLENGMKGARTPEIVDALVALLAIEPDADLRRELCFSVLDATGPEHVAAFLRTLRDDPDPRVRAQAADTLQHHLDDPAVRAALRLASEGDASGAVRAAAREMLGRWEED